MQKMILARTKEEREKYLDQLLPLQKQDFIGLYREMEGFPVTIRLLDPPLHEFLPKREDLMVEIAQLELTGRDSAKLEEKRRLLARVEELHEFNPMLGSARVPVRDHHAGNYAHAGAGGRGGGLRTGQGREEDRARRS